VAELWAEIVRQIVEGADVILGALLGAGSAFVASFFADRRRFKREDKYRDYAERRQV
jgi:membrane-associated phospholipid phosphatase